MEGRTKHWGATKIHKKKSNMKALNIHEERQWECIREQPWGVEAL